MKKFLSLILVVVSLMLFGCSKKEITYQEFKEKVEKEKYTVVEVTEQFKDYDYIKGAYVAMSSDTNYQIEFYTFEDNKNADAFYKLNKEILESEGSGNDLTTNIDSEKYSKYTLTTKDKYNFISRINNTVLYSKSKKEYKNSISKIIKKLGY